MMKKAAFFFILLINYSLFISAQTTGCVYGDCDNGYGKYVWENGDEYIGDWVDNQQEGNGTFYFKTGSKYVGEYKSGTRWGTGTYTWSTGEKHTGQWMSDSQHGEGSYYDSYGNVTVGVWKDGTYQGKIGEISGCIFGDCSDGYGTYVWTSGEKYTGNWVLDKRKGQGTNYFAGGDRYEGEWLNDLRNGYGTNYYLDGTSKSGMWENDKYTGTGENNYGCISGNCTDGYGIYTWQSGERYEGYWGYDKTDGISKRNGYGTNHFSNGATYTGTWNMDLKDGYGTYYYHPESEYKSYIGDYILDKMTGNGNFEYRNGQKYVGVLYNNYFHGEGTMYYADGTTESGTWENDKLIKKSVKTGCVSGNCVNGFGTYVSESGDKYIGTYKNSAYSGRGTYTFANGETYEGEFQSGTYNGQGTYKFNSGTKYVGEFKNGEYNGIGTVFYSDGTTKSGLWENNEYKGTGKNTTTLAKVTWLTPEYYTTTSDQKSIEVKICIKSAGELQNVQFYVNGNLKVNNATRGYTVVNTDCDYTINRSIPLDEGKNTLTVKVTNTAGETTSEARIINMKSKEVTSDEKRLALVIGNGEYLMSPLRNPPNDANVIADELKQLGFEVMVYTNLSQNDMKTRIREFGDKLSAQKGVGLFYYAGHGMQLNGENYIVPVSAVINKEQDVELEAVNLKRILGEMDYAENDLNIIILDACRNNPFARSFRSGGENGYASVSAPKGTYIAFATAPGSVASDGAGDNGLYTQELVKALKNPGLKIEDVFKQVRGSVYKISNQEQLTWENSSIFGDFYFKR